MSYVNTAQPIPIAAQVICPWCHDVLATLPMYLDPLEAKQHMRSHMYTELVANQVSSQEVALQQQAQLKRFLKATLY